MVVEDNDAMISAGLAESNGNLIDGHITNITCGLAG